MSRKTCFHWWQQCQRHIERKSRFKTVYDVVDNDTDKKKGVVSYSNSISLNSCWTMSELRLAVEWNVLQIQFELLPNSVASVEMVTTLHTFLLPKKNVLFGVESDLESTWIIQVRRNVWYSICSNIYMFICERCSVKIVTVKREILILWNKSSSVLIRIFIFKNNWHFCFRLPLTFRNLASYI